MLHISGNYSTNISLIMLVELKKLFSLVQVRSLFKTYSMVRPKCNGKLSLNHPRHRPHKLFQNKTIPYKYEYKRHTSGHNDFLFICLN